MGQATNAAAAPGKTSAPGWAEGADSGERCSEGFLCDRRDDSPQTDPHRLSQPTPHYAEALVDQQPGSGQWSSSLPSRLRWLADDLSETGILTSLLG